MNDTKIDRRRKTNRVPKVRVKMRSGMGCIPFRRDRNGEYLKDEKGNLVQCGIPFTRDVNREYDVFSDEARNLIARGYADYISGDISQEELLAGIEDPTIED